MRYQTRLRLRLRCASSTRFLAATRCSCSTLAHVWMHWSHLKTWRRARCGSRVDRTTEGANVFDPVAGGEALVVLDGHTEGTVL